MDSLHRHVRIALIQISPMFLYRVTSRRKEFALVCLVGLFVWLFGSVGLFVFLGFLFGFCFSGWLVDFQFGGVLVFVLVFFWGGGYMGRIGIYLFLEKKNNDGKESCLLE